ncbi:MAG: MltA domain-containing protein [Methylocystis sp.]|nr:MltA domain-containing protein [Methylocystis sp.]
MPTFADLEPISFDAIAGFAHDRLGEAFEAFLRSAALIAAGVPAQRQGLAADSALVAACCAALKLAKSSRSEAGARAFFTTWFRPFKLAGRGLATAYYEPFAEASLAPDAEFRVPVLARPHDLVTLNEAPICDEEGRLATSARRRADGKLEPYPDRRAIEDDEGFEQRRAIAYVRDRVELFLMQVQGSARLRLRDGSVAALTYDGRNGRPYASIGRLLVERGLMSAGAMSLAALKAKIRAMGLAPGAPGRLLMQENRSYVFFRIDDSAERRLGPIGGAGCALTPWRSIAVDRSLWPYGLPFWIATRIAWRGDEETTFERLMIAQDTGSAILGRARADLFCGAGEGAGNVAGRVRHAADFIVLLPCVDGGGT